MAYLSFFSRSRPPPNVDLMLAHRLRRWPNILSTLVRCLVFAGRACPCHLVWAIIRPTKRGLSGKHQHRMGCGPPRENPIVTSGRGYFSRYFYKINIGGLFLIEIKTF